MPIIVDPSFTPPPPSPTVTSSDGHLTATFDATWGGTTLKADFSGVVPTPTRVQFHRGDDLVRSGDAALAPGGVGVAYDHEASLGHAASWTATPLFADGSSGATSTPAVLSLPTAGVNLTYVWLKSILQPSLSRLVWMESPPKVASAGSTTLVRSLGSTFPVGSWDSRQAYTTSFALVTETAQQRVDLEALLDAGPLMCQSAPSIDLPDFYFLPGDSSWEWVANAEEPTRRWTVAVNQIDRPATVDAPLLIPGLSWDSLAVTYASWDALVADKASWAAVLGA